MTVFEHYRVAGTSVHVGFEIERLIGEGWQINPEDPLTAGPFGTLECGLLRDPANAKDAPPKLTRAEILAKARQAKADRQKEQKEGTANE